MARHNLILECTQWASELPNSGLDTGGTTLEQE